MQFAEQIAQKSQPIIISLHRYSIKTDGHLLCRNNDGD